MRRTSCSSLSGVLSTRSSCSTSPTSPTSLSKDYENFIMCPATIRRQNMSEQAHGDLSQTQSQDDEQARRGKEFTLTSWKTEIAKCRRPELLGLSARDAQVKPYLEQQKLGELITAEHEVLIETCESGNNHRCAIVGHNLAAKRSVMKRNFLEPIGKAMTYLGQSYLGPGLLRPILLRPRLLRPKGFPDLLRPSLLGPILLRPGLVLCQTYLVPVPTQCVCVVLCVCCACVVCVVCVCLCVLCVLCILCVCLGCVESVRLNIWTLNTTLNPKP